MKKIVIIANIDPFKNFGGVEFVCKNIAEKLQGSYSVFVVCRGYVETKYKEKNIQVIQGNISSVPIIGDFKYACFINKKLRNIKPDLVIDNGSLSFLSAKKYKTISITHGTNYYNYLARKWSFGNFIKKLYRYFWSVIQKKHLEKVNGIITVSEKIKQELTSRFYHIIPNKIHVIDNGTYISLTEEQKKEAINKKNTEKGIFVSTVHEWKGISVIEKLAKEFPNIIFQVCGDTYQSIHKNIISCGRLKHKEIKEKMQESDFFIFPSIYEGQSLAVLDALACGLPVILSEASNPGMIENKQNGYIVSTYDVNGYIESLRDLYLMQDGVKNIKKNNIDLMKNYTWEKQSEKYLNFINSFLGN